MYGRTANGTRWHLMHEGRALCGPDSFTIVATWASEGVPAHEDRCGNCDDRLRDMGRAKKKPEKKAYVNPKTVYRPRNRFEDK